MRIAKEEEKDDILAYLKKDIAHCMYLYIDIKKYGISTPNLTVWVEETNGVYHMVIMKYFNSMQIYSADDEWDLKECYKLIERQKPLMITGKLSGIEKWYELEQLERNFRKSEGNIFYFKSYREFQHNEKIEVAQMGDMRECAQLICSDEFFALNYTVEELNDQLCDRLATGMGRSCVIRRENRIIAHIATYAEEDKIAVTSGLVVHLEHRQMPLGTILESYLVNQLKREGYEVYTFVIGEKRTRLLKAMGAEFCGRYGKLNRKEKESG